MPDDITQQVIDLIAKSKNISPDTISPASTFEELTIDSLDIVNLSFEVEETFGITIADDSLNSLRTVGDVVSRVHQLQSAQQVSS